MNIQCYSQRLLNPFRGVINVIRYGSAEAVTTDGVHWDIYVRNAELADGLENPTLVQTSDIRYGKWSKKTGLKRGPLHPSEDFKRLEARGAVVFEHLLKAHDQLPFPFLDHYEYWLLDENRHPFALLDSAVNAEATMESAPAYWRAGLACRDSFRFSQELPTEYVSNTALSSAEFIERYINACAGATPTARWLQRYSDGSGSFIAEDDSADDHAENIPTGMFPRFFIRESGHDEIHTQLLQEFFQWQAPWLLLLTSLDETKRASLEQRARQRALDVARNHHLYPDVINEKEINAALVEAMLRSNAQSNSEQEKIMSTWYLELQSTTME
jgi:hypothetical protein